MLPAGDNAEAIPTNEGKLVSILNSVLEELYNVENTKKRPAEEPSPVIIPPLNLHNITPSPFYNSRDNYDYSGESTEASTEASL
ncbi:15911_t:CDS:2, partial [Dentiscutata erythropus]